MQCFECNELLQCNVLNSLFLVPVLGSANLGVRSASERLVYGDSTDCWYGTLVALCGP